MIANAMIVPEVLQDYVKRGVFRQLNPIAIKGVYDFVWLNDKRMFLQWNDGRQTIVFRNVLHDVPARSKLYRELRAFLKARSNSALPEHRRLDESAYDLVCENHKSSVSIGLKLKAVDEEQATRRLMSLVHETFLFLNDRWPDYMYESFGSPLE